MSGIEIIATALAAGAATGASAVASGAVQEAYQRLKELLISRLSDRPAVVEALTADETDSGVWRTRLGPDLAAAGIAGDTEIIAAAQRLTKLARETHVNVTNAQGVQIGDHNTQTNNFR